MLRLSRAVVFARAATTIALLAAIAALAACTTPDGLRIDKSFTNANLKAGKMGVAAVVHTTNPAANEDQAIWAELFTKVIDARKYNFQVVPPGPLAESIGDPLLTRARDEFSKGSLSDGTLEALRQQVRDVRYLAFGRVQADTVTTVRYESSRTEYAVAKKQKDKEKVTQVSATRRNVTMDIEIYDLKTKQSVWYGSVPGTQEAFNEHDRTEKRGEMTQTAKDLRASPAIVHLLDRMEGREVSKYPGFPPPPSVGSVMLQIYDVVAYHLPKW